MSGLKEIQEVYLRDIALMSGAVRKKRGMIPFLDGINNCRVHRLLDGIPVEDLRVNDFRDDSEER
jgi:hypothetical protein